MAETKKKLFGGKKLVFFSIFFFLVMALTSFLFSRRMMSVFSSYLKSQIMQEAHIYAELAGGKFQSEFEDLESIASVIEAEPDRAEDVLTLVSSHTGSVQGMLNTDGTVVAGESLPNQAFDDLESSFQGENTILFDDNEGLLFLYPVMQENEVKYVLYRLYSPEILGSSFVIHGYNDTEKIYVVSGQGQVIVSVEGESTEDIDWLTSDIIQEHYRSLREEMDENRVAAKVFSSDRGNVILYEAAIAETDYYIEGYISKQVVTSGVGSITLRMSISIFLRMVFVAMFAVLLVVFANKARESEKLKKDKALAEEASHAKSEFLANMSHEIRTPINAVLGMNEMILRESDDETILTYSENIQNAGGTLLGIINDILDLSRIEAGKIEIIPVKYDISAMINDLANMTHAIADEKGLFFKVDVDKTIPKHLKGDEVRIKQVITNILTNAVKYTEKGGVVLRISYEKTGSASNSINLKVMVKDTGIGIKSEDIPKLFSEFERIDEKRNRNIEGTGLGMNITERLLDLMGSSLKVESVYGEGSIFSFVVEQEVTDWEELGDYALSVRKHALEHDKYREKFTAPDTRVLVVDDNTMNLMVFKSLIKRTLVKVDTAISGDEGLELMKKTKYDIVFLDHLMPEKDGIETLRELRKDENGLNAYTPVICLTANALSGAREQYIEYGFEDYLSKPINSGKLEELLLKYLPGSKVQEAGNGAGKSNASGGSGDSGTENAGTEGTGKAWKETLKRLMECPDLEVANGITNSGSPEWYVMTVKIFYDTLDEKAEELEAFFREKDIHNYTIKAHALKSSARIVGAVQLGDAAELLETAGMKNDEDYILAHHEGVMSQIQYYKKVLRERLGEDRS